jgi:hypothetical protein
LKEPRHKGPHIVWLYLYEISRIDEIFRIGKSTETESRCDFLGDREGVLENDY